MTPCSTESSRAPAGTTHATRLPARLSVGTTSTSSFWKDQKPPLKALLLRFESIGDTSSVAGYRGDNFIADAHAANAQPMLCEPVGLSWRITAVET